ncbi:hypothetical protein P4H94_04415 [Paenibacillus macerans]|uniref:hypothetical protein n=1 Tax=Paenibacillus macerans TaxID=44252 RepID=UPI002DBFD660|nr:hypothetical protein [Paenibacillus macerans]MEC0136131.1 hypothetical protein [Paenibacillus macerans]
MAKSKLEKLTDAIEAAKKISGEAVAGDEPGQFAQESLDAFNQAIAAAQEIADVTDSEPATYEEALVALTASVKLFNESVVNDQTKDQNGSEPEKGQESTPQKLELKGVVLKGWQDGREGTHSIHLKKRIVSFVNGKANVTPELAEELQKAGYIE